MPTNSQRWMRRARQLTPIRVALAVTYVFCTLTVLMDLFIWRP